MKKKVALFMAAVLSMSMLSGCGGNKGGEEKKPDAVPEKQEQQAEVEETGVEGTSDDTLVIALALELV